MSILIYKPQNFKLWELVDPWTYERYGQRAWMFLDSRTIESIQQIRSRFGPCILNTYRSIRMIKKYGLRRYSGYRFPACRFGAPYSQHKHGRGTDSLVINERMFWVRRYIQHHPKEFPYITRMEKNTPWLHQDSAATNSRGIILFNP